MNRRTLWRPMQLFCVVALLAGIVGVPVVNPTPVAADHTADPTRVTVPGNFNEEIGCANGDWSPSCDANHDTNPVTVTPNPLQANDLENQGNGVWAREINIPATNAPYAYKAAINGTWNESYPVAGDVALGIAQTTTVKFYYDHKTHFVTDNFNRTIYTVPGSFNSELGCAGDWQPGCLRSLMSDRDGDGIYTFTTDQLPAGNYEFKVATDESWDNPNYPANNVTFSLPIGNVPVTISFDTANNTPTVEVGVPDTFYTVPGSFNNEIGCQPTEGVSADGDWNPACLLTLMSDPDEDGVFTFVTDDIPAGSYQFKVAVNGTWDVNYGLNGGSGDVPFTVPVGGLQVTFSFDSSTNIPTVAVEVPPPPPAEDAALLRAPVSDPANQDEIFYFVMPDRFANGSAANNTGGVTGEVLDHGFLPTDKGYYHGGDLAGLQGKLDYLEQLGITAIWMTPMFKNQPVQCSQVFLPSIETCSAAYHGYWPVDFTQIDPHFGTNAEMKAFVDAAQARGMRVFFDIITNHTADVIDYESGNYSYVSRADFPYRDAGGNIFNDRDFIFAEAFPAMDRYSFPKRPVFREPSDATIKVPNWLNDVTMYHNRGDAAFDGSEGDEYGDFVGLDGLFTERPEVVEGMIDIHEVWIDEFGIDGFRVDTVKHVNMEFWQQFVPAIEQYAAEQGKPEFFIFGEIFSGDPAFMSRYTREGEFPATLDFDFNYSAGDFAVGSAGPGRLSGLFAGDDYYTTATDNAYNQPTFLGNHDIGRIGTRMQQPAANDPDDAVRINRILLGYGLMFTARGVPIIYYGDEQGFTGDGNDKDARQSMFASVVDSYNDDDLIGTDSTTAVDNYNQSHPLYVALAELAELRKANPALQTGAQIERLVQEGGSGVYAFSRIDRNEKVEYVVALNNAGDARTVDIQTFAAQGTSFAAIYGTTGSVTANAAGQINLTVPVRGMVVYKQEAAPAPTAALAESPLGPIITFTNPISGSALSDAAGLLEVAVSMSGNAFAEVSFAVSVDGSAYEHIGTDTNAPFRVFYDTTGLPGGTQLSFKAVSTDLLGPEGNFYSTTTNVLTGTPAVCTVNYEFALIHYYRADGDYTDWGVHAWGDAGDPNQPGYNDWNNPIPFVGRTDFGAFAFIRLQDPSKPLNFIIHKPGGDTPGVDRELTINRSFIPGDQPQIFINSGEEPVYASQAAAQGYVTIHYNRPAGDYNIGEANYWGAHVFGDGVSDPGWATPLPGVLGDPTYGFTDSFGLAIQVPVNDATKEIGFIIHQPSGDTVPDDRETIGDARFNPATTPAVWINQGDQTVYTSRSAAEGVVTLRYHRPAGDYGDYTSNDFSKFWGLHTWAGTLNNNGEWNTPFKPNLPQDSFGIGFQIKLAEDADRWAYILHKGEEKDKQADQYLNIANTGNEIWIVQNMPGEYPYLLPVQPGCTLGAGNAVVTQRAHWVSADTFAWPIIASDQVEYTLHYAPNGGMDVVSGAITGAEASYPLTLAGDNLIGPAAETFPHLAASTMLTLDADLATIKQILTGQFWVSARSEEVGLIEVTGVQIPGVLDDVYAAAASESQLGVIYPAAVDPNGRIEMRLWAPTAQDVDLLIYTTATSSVPTTVNMERLDDSGIWRASRPLSDDGKFYLYRVTVYAPTTGQIETNLVTDPYAVSLSMNSTRSQIVNLAAPALKPAGWDTLSKPELDAFEDIVIYELHVRDFSITDETVPEEARGTFKAFTYENSAGMTHLRTLADDGLTHLHLLPVFDIATIEEDKSKRTELLGRFDEFREMAPNSEEQQAATNAIRDQDGFNWGYDPYHFNVPEGSYSTNPNGTTRIVEFREMVKTLNNNGLRVVVDVVYNHTNSAGQDPKSVFDKVVPGYYHRLNATGGVETSTCCQNTASEHLMMRKFMVESVVLWAKAYKVDAFRFDLMGHHMKEDMLAVRAALDALTIANDGVDGSKIYIYGEGWNFGEVVNGQRGVNATQRNMAGTGIGTFSDRLRDSVRGGGPFDRGVGAKRQGFINGLFYDPNEVEQGTPEEQKERLLHATDLIKVGLAGNLASFPLVNSRGNAVSGADIDYNGSPGGYTADPQEVITYISKHDNETLFDVIQLKTPATTTITDRVRIQNLGTSIVMLSQGVPFFHAGQDILRSKSGDRNSYNSGDWFNRIDWTMEEHNWGSGMPIQGDNNDNWDVLRPLLGNPAIKPAKAQIMTAHEHFREMLRIRKSSPLFRLRTAEQVNSLVSFYNNGPDQIPGLIVMRISDKGATDIDPSAEEMITLFNASDEEVTFTAAELADLNLALHAEQQASLDEVLAGASYDAETGTFTVPARTTVVFTDQVAQADEFTLYLPFVAR